MLLEQKFFDLIEANPVIAAIKDDRGLADCCSCEDIRVVFILYGIFATSTGLWNR